MRISRSRVESEPSDVVVPTILFLRSPIVGDVSTTERAPKIRGGRRRFHQLGKGGNTSSSFAVSQSFRISALFLWCRMHYLKGEHPVHSFRFLASYTHSIDQYNHRRLVTFVHCEIQKKGNPYCIGSCFVFTNRMPRCVCYTELFFRSRFQTSRRHQTKMRFGSVRFGSIPITNLD